MNSHRALTNCCAANARDAHGSGWVRAGMKWTRSVESLARPLYLRADGFDAARRCFRVVPKNETAHAVAFGNAPCASSVETQSEGYTECEVPWFEDEGVQNLHLKTRSTPMSETSISPLRAA